MVLQISRTRTMSYILLVLGCRYLDFFNMLTYDYHSAFEPQANHHAPLYIREGLSDFDSKAELNIVGVFTFLKFFHFFEIVIIFFSSYKAIVDQ